MAAQEPLGRLVLAATSVADDLGYVALADLASVLDSQPGTSYRIIGGHMVTVLVARWRLGGDLYRETGDADLGVPPVVARNAALIDRLLKLGYEPRAGDRFARTITDIPVHLVGGEPAREAVIDILVPAYTSRSRQNRRFGRLVTTEVPGLATAFNRQAITMSLELHRLNGETINIDLSFPDEVSALVLKAAAARVRRRATDVVDIWRCLEVGFAAGLRAREFTQGEPASSAAIVRDLFAERNGRGMTDLIAEQRLSGLGADARHTRLRALIARVMGQEGPLQQP